MSLRSARRAVVALAAALAAALPTTASALTYQPQITNGTDASAGEYPYMVGLVLADVADDFDAQFCGGSLIAPEWVLTAAHCVTQESGAEVPAADVEALVGALDLTEDDGSRVPVDEIIAHEGYDPSELANDIALLHLVDEQPPGNVIDVPGGPDQQLDDPGDLVTLTGWGGTTVEDDLDVEQTFATVLQEATMPIVASTACSTLVGAVVTDTQLCAGLPDPTGLTGIDACFGDSGGPLVATRADGDPVVLGLVSWGPGCGVGPSVYTRVSEYTDWIAEETDGDVAPPPDDGDGDGQEHVTRVAGADRYATAAQLALDAFEPGVPAAFVVTGATHPDALAAAPVAAAFGAPLLLTTRDGVPAATAQALDALDPDQIFVVGGAGAVSDAVVQALGATRVAGPDRYATAVALSQLGFDSLPEAAPVMFLAAGEGFADALAGGAAAAAEPATPLLLTPAASLSPVVADEIDRLQPSGVYVLGGTGVLSAGVEQAVADRCGCEVRRLAGVDRYDTAAQIALEVFGGFDEVVIATGVAFPDGLVAGSLGEPVLLLPPTGVPASVEGAIRSLGASSGLVLGGTGAVSDAQADEIDAILAEG